MEELQHIDPKHLSLLTSEQAHTFRVIPAYVNGQKIEVFGDESAVQKSAQLHLLLGKKIHIREVPTETLNRYLISYYPFEGHKAESLQQSNMAEESDIVRFVNKVFGEAADMQASDIHIERYELQARIRFRWEGQLVEKYEVPLAQYNAIISRIKIMAELDISERRMPQDGRIHLNLHENRIDVRVSSVPAQYGEKIVMRLLTRSKAHLQLSNIGLASKEEKMYQAAIQKPNGIILITGPTGSGKTTTLYATLNLLNRPEKNILTIEDPIEYNLAGINQIQLKEDIGLSFDIALRAFLRQDPDIIMLGEIRDATTAQMAIRAALTGHLVFSTLHTNSSWDAITRLTDMGVEAYLLAASIRAVVAQRLIRTLCPYCKKRSEEVLFLDLQWELSIHEHHIPIGCPECFYTGYKGRRAVFEILPITKTLSQMIKTGEGDIHAYMKENELSSLSDNLRLLVDHGEVSLEEAMVHLEG